MTARSTRNRSRVSSIAAMVSIFSMVLGGMALADNIVPDGDGLAAINHSSLAMGEVCATNGTDGYNGGNGQLVRLYLERTGNAATNPHTVWKNDTAVALSHLEGHVAIAVTMPDPSSITTPADWTTAPGGTTAGPANAVVRVEQSTPGALAGTGPDRKITFEASGIAADNTTTLEKQRGVEVTATIVSSSTATTQDCVLPLASITSPAAPVAPATITELTQNDTVASAFSCADSTSVHALNTGIASCTGQVERPDATKTSAANSGFNLPTADLGTHTLTVTAVDNRGNVATATRQYSVVAPSASYSGTFLAPVDGGGVINIVKQGRVVPVKLEISDGTNELKSGNVTFTQRKGDCTSSTTSDPVTETVGSSNSGNEFRFVSEGSDDFWQFNLNTRSLTLGCSNFDVWYGSSHVATFILNVTK